MGNNSNLILLGEGCYKRDDVINDWIDYATKLGKYRSIESKNQAIEIFKLTILAINNLILSNVDMDSNVSNYELIEKLKKQITNLEKQIKEIERYNKKRKKLKKLKTILIYVGIIGVVVALALAILIVNIQKKEESKRIEREYGSSKISVSVLDKTNKSQTTDYNGQTNYIITFKMYVQNDSTFGLYSVKGSLMIKNVISSEQIWKNDIYLGGKVEPKSNANFLLDITLNTKVLWNVPLEGMVIEYRTTEAVFKGYKTKTYTDTTYQVIYRGTANYKENLYQKALLFYYQENYKDAKELFEVLDDYKNSSELLAECEDKIWNADMLEALRSTAGVNAFLPSDYESINSYSTTNTVMEYDGNSYKCFEATINIPQNSENSFLDNFRNELVAKGFICLGNNRYRKGYTIIDFSELKDGYLQKYITYYAAYVG